MTTPIHWISTLGSARLAIMARPRGGEWLTDELASWKRSGVASIVSVLTDDEIVELDLLGEERACAALALEFIRFPIEDRSVPDSADAVIRLIDQLYRKTGAGRSVAIHCRAGIGRSAMIAACVLRRAGHTTDDAFALIEQARGVSVPDTDEQREWVAELSD